jgi:hypothetical protein
MFSSKTTDILNSLQIGAGRKKNRGLQWHVNIFLLFPPNRGGEKAKI